MEKSMYFDEKDLDSTLVGTDYGDADQELKSLLMQDTRSWWVFHQWGHKHTGAGKPGGERTGNAEQGWPLAGTFPFPSSRAGCLCFRMLHCFQYIAYIGVAI